MIFICYHRDNELTARRVDVALRTIGAQVWIDYRELDLSGDVEAQLNQAIRNSRLFLALTSNGSSRSVWVDWERRLARQYGIGTLEFSIPVTGRRPAMIAA